MSNGDTIYIDYVNQPNFSELDSTAMSYIKNKPTKLSEFENDENFVTGTEYSSSDNYGLVKPDDVTTAVHNGVISVIGGTGEGAQGPQGERGPKGETGKPGKDGKSLLTTYSQSPGWGSYSDKKESVVKLGASRGSNGWVDLFISREQTAESKYLPEKGVALYNPESRKINLRGLNVGSQIEITYSFRVETFHSNTEVWFRSFFPNTLADTTSFVGLFKYQHTYDLSVTHSIFINKEEDKISGIVPQIRTDLDASANLKTIYISVR
jgi:hypothetical protein